jgi:hypothetical protein
VVNVAKTQQQAQPQQRPIGPHSSSNGAGANGAGSSHPNNVIGGHLSVGDGNNGESRRPSYPDKQQQQAQQLRNPPGFASPSMNQQQFGGGPGAKGRPLSLDHEFTNGVDNTSGSGGNSNNGSMNSNSFQQSLQASLTQLGGGPNGSMYSSALGGVHSSVGSSNAVPTPPSLPQPSAHYRNAGPMGSVQAFGGLVGSNPASGLQPTKGSPQQPSPQQQQQPSVHPQLSVPAAASGYYSNVTTTINPITMKPMPHSPVASAAMRSPHTHLNNNKAFSFQQQAQQQPLGSPMAPHQAQQLAQQAQAMVQQQQQQQMQHSAWQSQQAQAQFQAQVQAQAAAAAAAQLQQQGVQKLQPHQLAMFQRMSGPPQSPTVSYKRDQPSL